MSALVSVEHLRLQLGDVPILKDVSFSLERGESVALTGPNGSGKTSILRCILGLVPFSGRVTVDGHNVVTAPVLARQCCAYLPQRPAFGDARADEVLKFAARLRRIDPSRCAAVLATVGLAPHAREKVRTFSGGMQQRLSLALALLADAPFMLLDEPTASLDSEGQRTFVEIVQFLRRSGRTMLLASHRPEEIHTLTDRVLRLDEGKLRDGLSAVGEANVISLHEPRGLR
jgi:ABC-type multidrug transport system ATPase subunit